MQIRLSQSNETHDRGHGLKLDKAKAEIAELNLRIEGLVSANVARKEKELERIATVRKLFQV